MYGKGARRGLCINQNVAAVSIDKFPCDACGLLGLPLRITDHYFNHAASEATRCVDPFDFEHYRVTR